MPAIISPLIMGYIWYLLLQPGRGVIFNLLNQMGHPEWFTHWGKVNAQFEVQHTVQTILFVLFWRWLVKKASSGLLMTTLPTPIWSGCSSRTSTMVTFFCWNFCGFPHFSQHDFKTWKKHPGISKMLLWKSCYFFFASFKRSMAISISSVWYP